MSAPRAGSTFDRDRAPRMDVADFAAGGGTVGVTTGGAEAVAVEPPGVSADGVGGPQQGVALVPEGVRVHDAAVVATARDRAAELRQAATDARDELMRAIAADPLVSAYRAWLASVNARARHYDLVGFAASQLGQAHPLGTHRPAELGQPLADMIEHAVAADVRQLDEDERAEFLAKRDATADTS